MTTSSAPVPTVDPGMTNEQIVLAMVEVLDRGTEAEVIAAVKAALIITRPELAVYATALDLITSKVPALQPDGRVGGFLSRIPILGMLFGRR